MSEIPSGVYNGQKPTLHGRHQPAYRQVLDRGLKGVRSVESGMTTEQDCPGLAALKQPKVELEQEEREAGNGIEHWDDRRKKKERRSKSNRPFGCLGV